MRISLALPLFLAALAAPEDPAQPEIRLPRASHTVAPGGLAVELTSTGGIVLAGAPVSLAKLAAALEKGVSQREREKEPPHASPLRLRLRVDERAPWRHVQWLLLAAAQAKIYRTEFGTRGEGGGEGALPAWLPMDRGIVPGRAEDGDARVRIRIVVDGERAAKFGPAGEEKSVKEPAGVAFLLGARRTKDRDELSGWIAVEIATAQCGGTALEWEIAADARIPFGDVARLLDTLRGLGVDAPTFYGTALPSEDRRAAPSLPYPAD